MKYIRGVPDLEDVAHVVTRLGDPVSAEPCPIGKGGKINPHVTRFKMRNGQSVSVFHVKPVYYEALDGSWRPMKEVALHHGNKHIDLVPDWDKKMSLAYLRWLIGRSTLLGGEVRIPWQWFKGKMLPLREMETILMTTTTAYPDAHPESTSVDGRIQYFSSTTWATVRDAATGTSFDDSSATLDAPTSGLGATSNYFINRLFTLFDTSAIPDTDTISAGVVSLYINSRNNGDNDGEDFVSVVTSSPASNTALATTDFGSVGTTEQHDVGERKDMTSIGTATYTDWTLNATGIGNISKTGITKFAFREGHDLLNSPYAGAGNTNNNLNVMAAEQTGTTYDPKLVVTHAAASTFIPKVVIM